MQQYSFQAGRQGFSQVIHVSFSEDAESLFSVYTIMIFLPAGVIERNCNSNIRGMLQQRHNKRRAEEKSSSP